MDTARLNLNDKDIYNWFLQLQHSIDNVPAHFAYIADEMGHQEFSDAKQRLCLVPTHVIKDACYEISRQGKRITLIGGGWFVFEALILTRSIYEDGTVEHGFANEKIDVYS
jgi:hypothetical protein